MHKLMQLKDELIEELESYAGEEKTVEHAMHIKCLASAADHLCNVLKDAEEEEQRSKRSMRMRSGAVGVYEDDMPARRSSNRYGVERGRAWSDSSADDGMRRSGNQEGSDDDYVRRVVSKVMQEMRG